MIKIQSLLNAAPPPTTPPVDSSTSPNSPPPTPGYTSQATSVANTSPRTPAPLAPPMNPRQKPPKDAAIFQRGTAKEPVNYAPYECDSDNVLLNRDDARELREQHKKFKIYPSGGDDGLIANFVRHIPYNSEKKTFFGRTGREGFELFQYVFQIPDEPGKEYVVMWDYQNGLVRITPFFKALNYAKSFLAINADMAVPQTTPNKVLGSNVGLRELSHSITGGSIAAQGYWMPYRCARAVCATFCWNIRWALTPIFGPSFVKDCIPPTDANFARFHIGSEVIRVSKRECEGWSNGDAVDNIREYAPQNRLGASPISAITSAPRAAPSVKTSVGGIRSPKMLRPRKPRVEALLESPFESDSDENKDEEGDYHAEGNHTNSMSQFARRARREESPPVSPKTISSSPATAWTSINNRSFGGYDSRGVTEGMLGHENPFSRTMAGESTGKGKEKATEGTIRTPKRGQQAMRELQFLTPRTPTSGLTGMGGKGLSKMPPPPTRQLRNNRHRAHQTPTPATKSQRQTKQPLSADVAGSGAVSPTDSTYAMYHGHTGKTISSSSSSSSSALTGDGGNVHSVDNRPTDTYTPMGHNYPYVDEDSPAAKRVRYHVEGVGTFGVEEYNAAVALLNLNKEAMAVEAEEQAFRAKDAFDFLHGLRSQQKTALTAKGAENDEMQRSDRVGQTDRNGNAGFERTRKIEEKSQMRPSGLLRNKANTKQNREQSA